MNPSESPTKAIHSQETASVEDRRRWPRFPDEKHSRVWFSTQMRGAQFGHLLDLALGGISLRAINVTGLSIGERVTVGLGDWMIPAFIRRIVENPNATYSIAMEWVRPESQAVASLLETYCGQASAADQPVTAEA
ncbi:MAG: PilZ domain-containing protein [Pirellulaceae bacterium]|nr:PilZ domain-containing protein [Pirellulaceae bacterium]